MYLFYAPEMAGPGEIRLSPEESHHAVRVLRLATGDSVELVDGIGGWYTGRIIDPDPRRCLLEVTASRQGVGIPLYSLHIAIAPTKQIDRFEWFIEKATEIGITGITPLICDRSERRDVKTERLKKVAVSAMKQSLKAFHPAIYEPVPFRQFVSRSLSGSRWIAHCYPGQQYWLDHAYRKEEACTVLIGPEGDFSPGEVECALNEGFLPLTLGTSRLRTETAGVVVVQTVNWLCR